MMGPSAICLKFTKEQRGSEWAPSSPPDSVSYTAPLAFARLVFVAASTPSTYSSSYSLKGLQRLVPDTIDERRFRSLCQTPSQHLRRVLIVLLVGPRPDLRQHTSAHAAQLHATLIQARTAAISAAFGPPAHQKEARPSARPNSSCPRGWEQSLHAHHDLI